MSYRSPFVFAIYADEGGRPCVMEYRVAFTTHEPWLAIVELRQTDLAFTSPVTSSIVRDGVLNRLLDDELRGLPLSAVRCVATDHSGSFEYRMDPDIHDYLQRGNRYKATPHPTRGGQHVERIEINPVHLVAGRVRVSTAHADPAVLPEAIASVLN